MTKISSVKIKVDQMVNGWFVDHSVCLKRHDHDIMLVKSVELCFYNY